MSDEPTEGTSGRASPPSGGRRATRVFLAISAVTATLIGVVGGVAYGALLYAGDSGPVIREAGPAASHTFGPCTEQSCNYLLLGSDSRTGLSKKQQVAFGTNHQSGGGKQSDVIMLVNTEPSKEHAVVLSFPRDLWVNIPGHGYDKINAAFDGGLYGGGPKLVAKTVEQLTGLKIDHFLYVDLAGFQGVVNALGGVDLCIPYHMVDPLTGLDLQPGCQTVDGTQSLAFVRTRHQPCDYIPDFARIGRQQQFLRAVLNKILSPSEIAKAPGLIKPVMSNLARDPDLKIPDLVYLTKQLQGVSSGAVEFHTVPSTGAVINGLDVLKLQEPVASRVFKDIREGRSLGNLGQELLQTAPSPANITVSVFDKSSGGKAQEVLTTLSDSGFDVSAGVQPESSLGGKIKGANVIAYAPGEQAMADVVHQYLTNLKEVQAPKGALPAGLDVGVIVSPTYKPVPVGSNTAQPQCPTA